MRDVEREKAWAGRVRRIGEWVDSLEAGSGAKALENGRVLEVRIKTNAREEGDTLIVVKATDGTGVFVAFVGARTAGEAMLAWRRRESGKGLVWREDRPWGEGGG